MEISRMILVLWLATMVFMSCRKKNIIEPEPSARIADSTLVSVSRDFEQELIRQGIDKNRNADGLVKYGDVNQVDSLFIYGSHLIKSLKGIEYFTKLRRLTLYMTQQDSLDLSKNEMLEYLNCQTGADIAGSPAALQYLNVRNCKKLTYLNCYNNLLTTVDVSQNSDLKYLQVGLNKKLTEVDLSANGKLEVFRSDGCWELARLDVSKNLKIKELYCHANYKLTSLNVSLLSNLKTLSLESCHRIADLRLGTKPTLDYLNVSSLPIDRFDFNQTPNLRSLVLNSIKFSILNVSSLRKLKYLDLAYAELPDLDVSKNRELEGLDISGSNLKEINLTQNIALKRLLCYHQPFITKLDLRNKSMEMCLAFNCEKLKSICVDKLPNPLDENWKISGATKFEFCN
ncbi:hypothetical protein [Dyadobacter sp. CY343]|uniref:hypothetical protein n=1 Tax=Dyadobacter sp. CY343 TaxID=2907299 RepID=UPI001F403B32|nr:hypothetical protein [Dyadobacter sp. CY343]MCE7062331.1 hypothetical protein [Dyadobacter sp. CY343]